MQIPIIVFSGGHGGNRLTPYFFFFFKLSFKISLCPGLLLKLSEIASLEEQDKHRSGDENPLNSSPDFVLRWILILGNLSLP